MKHTHKLTFYCSRTVSDPKNCVYPYKVAVDTEEDLRTVVRYDHVFAKYTGNRRSNDNFEYADLLVLDCDNDHSDAREAWIWPDDLSDLMPGVSYFTYSSRSDNLPKGDRSPRPRFHAIFPIDRVNSAEEYAALKQKTAELFPFFDRNALDAGRFFFGTDASQIEFHPGEINLTQYLSMQEEILPSDDGSAETENAQALPVTELLPGKLIPEGRRNTTLSVLAGKLLKRFGDSEEASQKFLDASRRCSPPLEERELQQIWNSALKFYRKISSMPAYIPPAEYGLIVRQDWEEPIPLEEEELPEFPVDTLPKPLADYVLAVAETLQVCPDMPAFCALGMLSLCLQKKFAVRVNSDWREPVNLYLLVVADPSEKKSPCFKLMNFSVQEYEERWNRDHRTEIETGKEKKAALIKARENAKNKLARGKGTYEELQKAVESDLNFQPKDTLRLFLGDVTPEKLTSQMAANNGVCSILSSEGGLFRNFAGYYSGSTNCDILLQAYSADTIRVDRSTRDSDDISSPALTMLVMMQPKLLSTLMGNKDFRGIGLNARFLYSIPKSLVGNRNQKPETIPPETREAYDRLITGLLETELCQTEDITLTEEAEQERLAFAVEVERKLPEEFDGMRDWAGKILGTTMRIAGLLCVAESGLNGRVCHDDWADFPHYEITADQMRNAIRIAHYCMAHAKAAYNQCGGDEMTYTCRRVLKVIRKKELHAFTLRDLLRDCHFFKKADDVQKVLDHMSDLGFFTIQDPETHRKVGRPSNPTYLSNPIIFQEAITGAA